MSKEKDLDRKVQELEERLAQGAINEDFFWEELHRLEMNAQLLTDNNKEKSRRFPATARKRSGLSRQATDEGIRGCHRDLHTQIPTQGYGVVECPAHCDAEG